MSPWIGKGLKYGFRYHSLKCFEHPVTSIRTGRVGEGYIPNDFFGNFIGGSVVRIDRFSLTTRGCEGDIARSVSDIGVGLSVPLCICIVRCVRRNHGGCVSVVIGRLPRRSRGRRRGVTVTPAGFSRLCLRGGTSVFGV